jgi:hypothetical protein
VVAVWEQSGRGEKKGARRGRGVVSHGEGEGMIVGVCGDGAKRCGNDIPTAASIRFSALPADWEEECLDGRVGGIARSVCSENGWFAVCCLMVGRLFDVWARRKLRCRDKDEMNGSWTLGQWKELKLAKNKR